ncbi:zinc finger, C3HC4 type (RING finger) protein [Medicago truncatula]|uniref:RBR-type E3 ubiquitin transferase n=2 Tax=Medicago truncatula TaxID=3880 RepID=A0A072V7L1_MEDTR|nr:zinc finger, C3HC4 type (RING finger) protein [Medicago truncatula]
MSQNYRLPMTPSHFANETQSFRNRKSLLEDRAANKTLGPKKIMSQNYSLPLTSHFANETQSSRNRKSLLEDHGEEKKKQATTRTIICQGQSSKSFSCGICFDSVTVSKMFTTSSCNHPFCTNCISMYVDVQRKENVVKLNCPNPDCSVELKPEHVESIIPKQVIVEWESAIYESSIAMMQKMYCPYENCSLLLVNDEVEVVTSCECPSCHRLFCAQCKVPWHTNMNCQEFQEWKDNQDEEQLERKFLELANSEKWQRCPKCSMHVQRNGGCEHMRCRCGCNFCYNCGSDWIYGHTCNTPS